MPKPATGKFNKTITTDTVMVMGLQIATFPVGNEGAKINYASGYTDGEGKFVPVEHYTKVITGAEFAALAQTMPNASKNFFDNLSDMLYAEIEKDA